MFLFIFILKLMKYNSDYIYLGLGANLRSLSYNNIQNLLESVKIRLPRLGLRVISSSNNWILTRFLDVTIFSQLLKGQNDDMKIKLQKTRLDLEKIKELDYLEAYARQEKFFKRKDEDIFVITND